MKDFGQEQPLVLVVGNEPKLLGQVASLLAGAHFACQCCATSEAALAAVQQSPPDLLICDVNLHSESDVDACLRIKQQPGLEDVPVMFLSGAQLPDVIRRSHEAGGSYALRKPFAPAVLMELIDQALGVAAS